MPHTQPTPTRARRSPLQSRHTAGIIAATVSLIVLVLLLRWQVNLLNWLLIVGRRHWIAWLLFWTFLAGVGVAAATWTRTTTPKGRRGASPLLSAAALVLVGVGAVGGVLSFLFSGYERDRAILTDSIHTTSDPIATYQSRAPFVIAKAQATGHMTTNGTIEDTNYVATLGHYGSLVEARGVTSGYQQVVWQQIGATGQATAQDCQFHAFVPRLGGNFRGNLQRAVVRAAGYGTIITASDSYGYCTGSTAHVVVPLKKLTGFWYAHEVPAGVAVIDGDTGKLSIVRDTTTSSIPGPVYPVSLAAQQEQATTASAGWWAQKRSRAGWESPSDDDDVNAQNNAQFNLAHADNKAADYVSPLTLVGNSSAIGAVGTVPSSSVRDGQLNSYTVHTLAQARQSNSAVVTRLQGDYGNLPEWAAHMSVFEVAPIGADKWQATLGLTQAVSYVAHINPDSSSCLYNTTGVQIQCSATTTGQGNGSATTVAGIDVSKLTNQQLTQLAQATTREMARRMK